jgi:SAM-dependent methyltransferase
MKPRNAPRQIPKKKRRPGVTETAVIAKLQDVRTQRGPFRALTQALIADLLTEYTPAEPLVEIGAGDGQLCSLLPQPASMDRVFTEPTALGVKRFLEIHPDEVVKRAPAEALPFGDGQVGCVIGLCVLDVVKDGAAVARECARVLKPGGVFIHLLDMSADPLAPILQLQASRLLVIPNVFSDPCEAAFPEDMFVAPIAEMAQLAQILDRHRHPFAAALRKYVALYQAVPFSAAAAASAFAQLADDPKAKVLLRDVLKAAGQLATPAERAQLARFQGHPVSAAKYFESRLLGWFSPELGFRVELSGMLARWEVQADASAVTGSVSSTKKYLSIAAGHVRHLAEPPPHLLNPALPVASVGVSWREQSVFVFVARKVD